MLFAIVTGSDGFPMELGVEVPGLTFDDSEPRVCIGISAAGGGSVGVAYGSNGWEYAVQVGGEIMFAGSDLRSGMPKTHQQMARILAGFLADSGEAESLTGIQRAFLVSNSDRLALFAEGS